MANPEASHSLSRGQFGVVRDVALTLANVLKSEIAEASGIDAKFLLELPEDLPSDVPAVAICLYHLGTRSTGYALPDRREVEEGPGGTIQEIARRPPLFLDLRFLVTAYAKSPRDELALLGLALRAFWDTDEIKDAAVVGDSIHLEDRPGIEVGATAEEMRKIWESFQQPYRPSFSVSVEARLDSKIKRVIRRVRETVIDFKKIDG